MSNEDIAIQTEPAAPEITFEQLRAAAVSLSEQVRDLTGLVTAILLHTEGGKVELSRSLEHEVPKHGFSVNLINDGDGVRVSLVNMEELEAEMAAAKAAKAAEGDDPEPDEPQQPEPASEPA